jgi:hypothetical protein
MKRLYIEFLSFKAFTPASPLRRAGGLGPFRKALTTCQVAACPAGSRGREMKHPYWSLFPSVASCIYNSTYNNDKACFGSL